VCADEAWPVRTVIAVRPLSWILAAAVLVPSCASGLAACGGDSQEPRKAASKDPIPASLRTVESASEDIIDLALGGDRAGVIAKAKVLRAVADGSAASTLRAAGAPAAEIVEFQRRAAAVARASTRAPLLDVALASNAAFGMVPAFFARYDDPVPADVTTLDHLDFAAKLQSLKGDGGALAAAVRSLKRTWGRLRPSLVAAGGAKVAVAFDEHVDAMRALVANRQPAKTEREAQHGLDLVDELESVYSG
jgi:hypothetical protein